MTSAIKEKKIASRTKSYQLILQESEILNHAPLWKLATAKKELKIEKFLYHKSEFKRFRIFWLLEYK